jgi:hypothetical protein
MDGKEAQSDKVAKGMKCAKQEAEGLRSVVNAGLEIKSCGNAILLYRATRLRFLILIIILMIMVIILC